MLKVITQLDGDATTPEGIRRQINEFLGFPPDQPIQDMKIEDIKVDDEDDDKEVKTDNDYNPL